MSKSERMTKPEAQNLMQGRLGQATLCHSSFGFLSGFVILSDLVVGTSVFITAFSRF